MRWNAETDKQFLLAILSTHKVKIDYARVAEVIGCTEKACSLRLNKLRKMTKDPGHDFSVSSTKTKRQFKTRPSEERVRNLFTQIQDDVEIKLEKGTKRRKIESENEDVEDDEDDNEENKGPIVKQQNGISRRLSADRKKHSLFRKTERRLVPRATSLVSLESSSKIFSSVWSNSDSSSVLLGTGNPAGLLSTSAEDHYEHADSEAE